MCHFLLTKILLLLQDLRLKHSLFETVFSSLLPQHFMCIEENGFTNSCEYVSLSENCELLEYMYYAIFLFS